MTLLMRLSALYLPQLYTAGRRPYSIHSRPAFLGLNLKQNKMATGTPVIGRTRSQPESREQSPNNQKKPRINDGVEQDNDKEALLDALVDTLATQVDRSIRSLMSPKINPIVPPSAPNPQKVKEKKPKKGRKGKQLLPEPYSANDVLWRDVVSLLGQEYVDKAIEENVEWESPFESPIEVELHISSISSGGEGLALAPEPYKPWVVVVPLGLPGEKVRAKVFRHSRLHSFADLLSVEVPNPALRDSSRVKCKYFGKCSGCQYQMLSYETQLDLKRDVIVKAYKHFSGLPEASVPEIRPTIASPLQYGYRTKISPHFEAPPKKFQWKKLVQDVAKPDWLKIGFNQIGTRHVMDIEECPIAMPVLNEAYRPMREDIIKNIHTYKKGVSLLLRDSIDTSDTASAPSRSSDPETPDPLDTLSSPSEKHVCISNHKATIRERVGDMVFEYPGHSFFQNNNSALIPLTNYVRDAILRPASESLHVPTHLVDAYCGAGLFAITLAPHFKTVTGIELSSDSIRFATRNAELNKFPPGKCTFRAGDAADIFATVGEFPRAQTVLVIDPPRKGCDDKFIEQLLSFRCATVVYVSCNVHTQARDIGMILEKSERGSSGGRYVLESLRGFDLFPQTAHVESVAVLRLV